jgi:NAD(P)H-nitrite reductase large subunit
VSSHLVIIGNGIAGITLARHVRQQDSQRRITVISAESEHFYSRTALMYIYMGHMRYEHTKPYEDFFWQKNRIDLRRGYVRQVDTGAKRLLFETGDVLPYDTLVLATGSKPALAGWPGETLTGVQGLYGLPDLATMERDTAGISRAVVVGGGLIGVEMAEMLHSRGIAVTMLVRDNTYWGSVLPAEEGTLLTDHLRHHHIDLRLGTELHELLPDADDRVRAVTTLAGETIDCQFVGLAIGVVPNVGFLQESGVELGKGVLVNDYFETNVPDVYAIGDCNEFRGEIRGTDGAVRKANEQIWYTGRMHGETLARTLCGHRTAYRPGVFFNSAKFFDIEYQTYGTMNPRPAEGEGTFYWQHPHKAQCLRINYRADTQQVVGIHALGLRLRQAVCADWIQQRQPLPTVLADLSRANFNPEFFEQPEPAIQQQADLPTRRKGWWQRVFAD